MSAEVGATLDFTVSCKSAADLEALPDDKHGVTHKKVHFIRHGEGHHNVAQKEWRLRYPGVISA